MQKAVQANFVVHIVYAHASVFNRDDVRAEITCDSRRES